MNSAYFTVLGYDKDADTFTHFSDFSAFSKAKDYAKYLAVCLKPKCADGDGFDWYEILDSNKKRVAVVTTFGVVKMEGE